MKAIPFSLDELILQFSKLPGVGKKTAERLSLYILKSSNDVVLEFSESLKKIKENIILCERCHCFKEKEICGVCDDESRNRNILCIVEDPTDVFIIDKSGFNGVYHVLGGLVSPLDGVTPESLNIETLVDRLDLIDEIVIGLNPSSEGDMTNLYLSDLLKPFNVKLSRLARGVPVGSSLEFIDQVTLTHSINDRVEIK
tara:strand:+ start:4848 stop:5441 length:594 start_codon:yes stop_codon:yes gene_type:complete